MLLLLALLVPLLLGLSQSCVCFWFMFEFGSGRFGFIWVGLSPFLVDFVFFRFRLLSPVRPTVVRSSGRVCSVRFGSVLIDFVRFDSDR